MRFSARSVPAVFCGVSISLLGSLIATGNAAAPQSTNESNPLRSKAADQRQSLRVQNCQSGACLQIQPPRVGTMIPPTEGRFIVEKNGCFFVADYPEFAAVVVPGNQRRSEPTNVYRVVSDRDQYVDADEAYWADSKSASLANPLRVANRANLFAFDEHATDSFSHAFPERMAVAENLMLDRVIEQMGGDRSSIGWVVSGEIIPQHGSPRLLIHAANESSSSHLLR